MCIRSGISKLCIGSLNVRGIKEESEQTKLADDMQKYRLEILGIQEHHMKGTGVINIKTSDRKNEYEMYYTGPTVNKYHGVGIVIKKDFQAEFDKISDRICVATISLEKERRNLSFISTYAPTLDVSEKHEEIREQYYQDLEKAVRDINNRNMVIIAGDMNAKTGSSNRNYPEAVGRYGKGQTNSSGEYLVEFALQNDLFLTNTRFPHKMCHRTTWTGPERKGDFRDKNGKIRRNPYRNQIDYIMIKNRDLNFVEDSRSYGGINTQSDHKLVKTRLNIRWYRMKVNKSIPGINLHNFKDKENQRRYKEMVKEKLENEEMQNDNPQMKWKTTANACIEAAEEILGRKEKGKKRIDQEMEDLSQLQKKIRDDIEANTKKKDRENLRKQRNEIMNKLHQRKQKLDRESVIEKIEEIEKYKDDSNRMYQVVRQLQPKGKEQIIVNTENGVTASEQKQLEIVTEYFRGVFRKSTEEEVENVQPTEMRTPFNSLEIKTAVKKLKNNKSPGIDEICAEMVKYSPEVVHRRIAEVYNEMARTGEVPQEIIEGILVPLPKPGKPRGPPGNLRPVVLLTILRKILAICMIGRTHERIRSKIPLSQAAYQGGRNTTEHVFTCKILAEKAITSDNYKTNILLLDMSKAFDTVQRNSLVKQLKSILEDDELHMIKILLTDVKLRVRMGKRMGEEIVTNIGVPQGDCLSPILFTLYLANALDETVNHEEHSYSRKYVPDEVLLPENLIDHSYFNQQHKFPVMDQQYADDIGWKGSNASHRMKKIKDEVPTKLEKHNLHVNDWNTEEYEKMRNGPDDWKRC